MHIHADSVIEVVDPLLDHRFENRLHGTMRIGRVVATGEQAFIDLGVDLPRALAGPGPPDHLGEVVLYQAVPGAQIRIETAIHGPDTGHVGRVAADIRAAIDQHVVPIDQRAVVASVVTIVGIVAVRHDRVVAGCGTAFGTIDIIDNGVEFRLRNAGLRRFHALDGGAGREIGRLAHHLNLRRTLDEAHLAQCRGQVADDIHRDRLVRGFIGNIDRPYLRQFGG